jgi:hypothetical protein
MKSDEKKRVLRQNVIKGPGYPGIRTPEGIYPGCLHPPGKRHRDENKRLWCDVCDKDITDEMK